LQAACQDSCRSALEPFSFFLRPIDTASMIDGWRPNKNARGSLGTSFGLEID
jgi:hypothetical protein